MVPGLPAAEAAAVGIRLRAEGMGHRVGAGTGIPAVGTLGTDPAAGVVDSREGMRSGEGVRPPAAAAGDTPGLLHGVEEGKIPVGEAGTLPAAEVPDVEVLQVPAGIAAAVVLPHTAAVAIRTARKGVAAVVAGVAALDPQVLLGALMEEVLQIPVAAAVVAAAHICCHWMEEEVLQIAEAAAAAAVRLILLRWMWGEFPAPLPEAGREVRPALLAAELLRVLRVLRVEAVLRDIPPACLGACGHTEKDKEKITEKGT